MPANRNALIRYKTIDQCLRNRYRKWTLEDLIDACSEALYEYEGIDKGVSKRTVQMDIQVMRSEKLGYNAPIVVKDKKYYTYEDEEYSITNIPLTDQDLGRLTEVVELLKQFKGFSHFQDIGGMVQRLEDKIHTSKTKQRPIIDLEKNEDLKGLEYVEVLYGAIQKQKSILITYQSFRARKSNTFTFHPALLKEFRNRWFVLGKKEEEQPFMLLALDRIQAVDVLEQSSLQFDDEQVTTYFANCVGVTVNDKRRPVDVKLFVDKANAPYVLTKPIHSSQKVIETNNYGVIITFKVHLNPELEREILGFGDAMEVLAPEKLRNRIYAKIKAAQERYFD